MPYAKDHKATSKDRILSSAIELFARYGFDHVSIGEVMKKAKLTHGAFYSHFESKEALFKESFWETLKRSRAGKLMKGPLSIKHLTELVSNYWNLREFESGDNPGPEAVLFNEVGSKNTGVKALFEQSYFNLKKMVEMRLLALSKLKQLPISPDRETVAEKANTILTILIGAVVIAKSISTEEERTSILESAQKEIMQLLGMQTQSP